MNQRGHRVHTEMLQRGYREDRERIESKERVKGRAKTRPIRSEINPGINRNTPPKARSNP